MTSTQNIAIPSGRPHVELKPSFTTTPAPTPEEESAEFLTGIVEAMAENNTGLLDSGSALSSSLGHELHVHTGRTSGGKTTFVNTKPYVPADFTDEDLVNWAQENRKRETYGNLSVGALRYWLRYTFDSYTPEYRELASRLEQLVK